MFDLRALNGTNGFAVLGLPRSQLGNSVSTAGDMNGDGLGDVLLGASSFNNYHGASYIIFGQKNGFPTQFNLTTLNGENGFVVPGLFPNSELGHAVSTAGDINGDDIDDIVIGALNDSGYSDLGVSYIIFGQKNGFPAHFNLTTLNGVNGFAVLGLPRSRLGDSVSPGGDINGDGLDDIVLGAPGFNNNQGASFIIFGQKTGFLSNFNLMTLNGSNGFAVLGLPGSFLGFSVSPAGDINGDGLDDMLLGAPGGPGASYIIFGQKAGFPANFTVTTLNGVNGFAVLGLSFTIDLGFSVSTAGDINGDGLDDVLLGARFILDTQQEASYIIFGQKAGFPANFTITTLNGTNGFAILGGLPHSELGNSVSTVGDMNGDGFDDIVLGAPYFNTQQGASYIIFGQKADFPAQFNLTALNGVNGFAVPGLAASRLGFSVSTAGDMNGDGLDDLALGANYFNHGAGASYIIFGQAIISNATLWTNNLLALQGKPAILTSSNLNATDPSIPSAELTFITDVNHGQFEYVNHPKTQITQFSQYNVSLGAVLFRTDDSGSAPSYSISIPNNMGFTIGPFSALITFHDAPILRNNQLFATNGQSTFLTSADLSATEKYTPEENLVFIVSNVQHGQFQLVNTSGGYFPLKFNMTQFTQQNITNGIVRFIHDGSNTAPRYSILTTDGQLSSPLVAANITFHDAPVLDNNRLNIAQGLSVRLSKNELSARESYTPDADLVFTVSEIQHGQFQLLNATGHPVRFNIIQFAQQNITNRIIQFTQDGSPTAPSYRVSVSDGQLSSGAPVPAQITFKKAGGGSDTSLIDKMGGWYGIAGIIAGGVLLILVASIVSSIGVWRFLKHKKTKLPRIIKLGNDSNFTDAPEQPSLTDDTEKNPLLPIHEQDDLSPKEVGSSDKELKDYAASSLKEGQASGVDAWQKSPPSSPSNPARFPGSLLNTIPRQLSAADAQDTLTGSATMNL